MADEKNDAVSLPPSRRRFIATALTAISAAVTSILGIPLAGFFALPALRRSERRWLEVEPISEFAEGEIKKVLAKPLTAQVWPYEAPPVAIFVLNRGGENSLCTISTALT